MSRAANADACLPGMCVGADEIAAAAALDAVQSSSSGIGMLITRAGLMKQLQRNEEELEETVEALEVSVPLVPAHSACLCLCVPPHHAWSPASVCLELASGCPHPASSLSIDHSESSAAPVPAIRLSVHLWLPSPPHPPPPSPPVFLALLSVSALACAQLRFSLGCVGRPVF